MSDSIGFIGLGNMGLPIATNLLNSGFPLRVYNRTRAKAEPLERMGATVVSSPAETATPGGVVFSIVADDAALTQVAVEGDALARTLGPGGVHISMSTVSPDAATRVAQHHEAFGVSYVAAPVFGRPEAAVARKLWVCNSGPSAAKQRVRPILEKLGQTIFDLGDAPGAGHLAKLIGNFWIVSSIEMMAEGFALAEKNGLDPAMVADLLSSTVFACPIFQNYGKIVLSGKYEPAGFRMQLGLKDVRLVLKTADASQVPLPFASLLHDRFIGSVSRGRGDLDWTGITLDVRDSAGLK
jgi:3-hydroxyisobutyrate dehydrogenase-like beta-hydroxyacid dehydrogenase